MFVDFLKQVEKRYYCCFKYSFCVNAKVCCEKNRRRKDCEKNFSYCEVEKQQKIKDLKKIIRQRKNRYNFRR